MYYCHHSFSRRALFHLKRLVAQLEEKLNIKIHLLIKLTLTESRELYLVIVGANKEDILSDRGRR